MSKPAFNQKLTATEQKLLNRIQSGEVIDRRFGSVKWEDKAGRMVRWDVCTALFSKGKISRIVRDGREIIVLK